MCLDDDGPFQYGIYADALPVISSNSLSVRILYPIFWGLLNLRFDTFHIINLINFLLLILHVHEADHMCVYIYTTT